MSTERESFEAWIQTPVDAEDDPANWIPPSAFQCAWEAWQARAAIAEKPALTDEQIDVLYRDWNLGRHPLENERYFTRPLPKQIEIAFRDGARAVLAAKEKP